MSKSEDFPITQAVRALRSAKVGFTPHLYDYVEHGGTAHSAASLGVDEHTVIKTIILEDERKQPLICLQHGDREVSTKNLAR
ncbi:MAG TPA: YbaK/EbsC family protein, partial [Casimicrobium huifangae]|nr:YbaK/EbsC family protein [Casimicrobium huifangae]